MGGSGVRAGEDGGVDGDPVEERSWSEQKLEEVEARSKDEDRTTGAHPCSRNGASTSVMNGTEPGSSSSLSRSLVHNGEEEEKDVGDKANAAHGLNRHRSWR